MNAVTVGTMIGFGWETFKKRPWFFIGVLILIGLVSGIASQLGSSVGRVDASFALVLGLAGVFVSIVMQILLKMGTIAFALKAHDAPQSANWRDLWAPEMFWNYLGASLLVGLIVIAGLILLIAPGIIWALRYMFVPYIVIDRKLGVMEALHESARITVGHKWQLLLLVIALVLFNILGALVLLVGLLVTVPITMLALAHAYRTLEHAASEIASTSA